MKKQFLLVLSMVAILICLFAVSASAVTPDNDGEVFVATDGTSLALYDTEGKALAWFYDSETSEYVPYRVGVDFTMTLNSGRELVPATVISDTDGDDSTAFPYTVSNMILMNGRDYAAFTYISGTWKDLPIQAIYVNKDFKWINKQAFNNNATLRVFDIPKDHNESVTLHIGAAFVKANALESFYVPKTSYFESTSTFEYSTGLKSVEFHDEWTGALKGYEFNGCTALESVKFPSTITQIPTKVCYNTALAELTIPASVTYIGSYAFNNCDFASVVFPSGIKTIDQYAFAGNKVLTTAEFANLNSTEEIVINDAAFENCTSLTGIVLPEGLTKLGNCMFKGCSSFKSVTFPTTLTTLSGKEHFLSTALEEVVGLEKTQLTEIPQSAFKGATKWTPEVLKLPDTVTTIGWYGFADVGAKVVILSPNLTTFSSAEAFVNCANLKAVYVPDTITSFGTNTFKNNKTGNILFFVTSTDSTYLDSVKSNFACADIVSYETYSADSETYAKGRHVISGYNFCDAFYDGIHSEDNNPCVINCSQCGTYGVAEENPVHNEIVSVSYANGYNNAGFKVISCNNEGCSHNVEEEASALFICLGYAAPENGALDGIAVGFMIDKDAIAAYTEVTGVALKYGVFVAAYDNIGDNGQADLVNADETGAEGVICANISDMKNYEFSAFAVKLVGFKDDTYKDVPICLGAYVVAEAEGENAEVSYLQAGTPNEGDRYAYTTYNTILGK